MSPEGSTGRGSRTGRGGDRRALSVLPQRRQPGHRLARSGRGGDHPPAAVVPRVRAPVRRGRGTDGAPPRRRRSRPACGRRFTTVEEAVLAVVKRSGVSEPFNRSKVVAGVRRACQGRPVDEDQLQLLAQQVEDAIRATGAAEVPSNEVGLAILRPLRELDEVAYLRFASVYRSFASVADFEKEIAELKARQSQAADATAAPSGD